MYGPFKLQATRVGVGEGGMGVCVGRGVGVHTMMVLVGSGCNVGGMLADGVTLTTFCCVQDNNAIAITIRLTQKLTFNCPVVADENCIIAFSP